MTVLYLKTQNKTKLLEQLRIYLSDERCLKTDKLKFERDKMLSIGAEVLLYLALRHKGYDFKKIQISKNSFGKPFLRKNPDIHFNISHSIDFVICALSSCEIGIDVEKNVAIDYGLIVESFSPLERRYVLETNAFSNERCLRLWTLKESYLKCIGTGLRAPLNSIVFDLEPHIKEFKNYLHECHYFSHINIDDYIISICAKQQQQLSLIQATEQDIKALIAKMARIYKEI